MSHRPPAPTKRKSKTGSVLGASLYWQNVKRRLMLERVVRWRAKTNSPRRSAFKKSKLPRPRKSSKGSERRRNKRRSAKRRKSSGHEIRKLRNFARPKRIAKERLLRKERSVCANSRPRRSNERRNWLRKSASGKRSSRNRRDSVKKNSLRRLDARRKPRTNARLSDLQK